MEAPVLDLRDVSRSFGGIQAVRGVSLRVERREIVGLIGPNGSGKSTLFNVVSGAIAPAAGRVRFCGVDITGWRPYRIARAGIARTFQIPALFENMTVLENLLAAAVEGDWRGAPARAVQVIDLLRLAEVRHSRAADLSGGQQRLVELARVLMRDPVLVLLDEVTAGVHAAVRSAILDVVRGLRGEGVTFVLIEHDMELVRAVCDRVVVMNFGAVVASGDFETITRDSEVMQAYLGRRA